MAESKVIDGLLYSTEESTEVVQYCPIGDTGDLNYLKETLYRTDNGRYFLHGTGGAKTKYAESVSNGVTSGSTIKALSTEEALEWCEKRDIDGEIVADEFDDEIEPA